MQSIQIKYSFIVLTTLSCLLITLYLLSFVRKANESDAILSTAMVPVDGLTYREYGRIKTVLFKNRPVPDHGLFGLHVVDRMQGNKDFENRKETFFNYHFLHTSLYEMYLFIKYLKHKNLLPKKSLLITLPNPHLGKYHYVKLRFEMPSAVYWLGMKDAFKSNKFSIFFNISIQLFIATLDEWFDWKNMLYSIKNVVAQTEICNETSENLLTRILPQLQELVCSKKSETYIVTENGARVSSTRKANITPTPSYNEIEFFWKSGDAEQIAAMLKKFIAFGETNNREVYFIIPPVYFTERKLEHPNEVMTNKILSHIPEKHIIDDRSRMDKNNFVFDSTHPSTTYWENVKFP